MRIFTYQIGDGDGQTIAALVHSETLSASNLDDAIAQAQSITKSRAASETENTVRLLEEFGDDSRAMWVRPVKAVRGA